MHSKEERLERAVFVWVFRAQCLGCVGVVEPGRKPAASVRGRATLGRPGSQWGLDYRIQLVRACTASGFRRCASAGNTSELSDGLPTARLEIIQAGLQIRVLWLTNLAGFVLQSNSSVLQSNTWSNVSGTAGVTNASFFREFPLGEAPRFFRLRLP